MPELARHDDEVAPGEDGKHAVQRAAELALTSVVVLDIVEASVRRKP